jgi:DNA-binding MarR family transcriptional regulator
MHHTKAGRAFTNLIFETFRLNGRLLLAGDRLARPLVLTSSRWQVLGAIEDQPSSVAEIARKMGLARQNVQRLADALRKQGLIDYAPNPKHLRAKLVCLTTRGARAVQLLGERQVQWANRIVSKVGSEEIEAALSTMSKLRALVETDGGKTK